MLMTSRIEVTARAREFLGFAAPDSVQVRAVEARRQAVGLDPQVKPVTGREQGCVAHRAAVSGKQHGGRLDFSRGSADTSAGTKGDRQADNDREEQVSHVRKCLSFMELLIMRPNWTKKKGPDRSGPPILLPVGKTYIPEPGP